MKNCSPGSFLPPGLQFLEGVVRIPDKATEFRQRRGMIMSTKPIRPTAANCIDLSAAALHIIAMTLMLMDHLWATLLPGAGLADLCRAAGVPYLCFYDSGSYFHTRNLKRYALRLLLFALLSEVPFDLMYGGTWFYPVHQNVIWTLLLGLLGVHLMETVRKKQKALGLAAGVRRSGSSRGAAGNAGHDGLLRCRCADRVRFLHFPGPEMVVPAGTGADPVLDQRGASGRADVPHPAVQHGV